MTHIQIMRLSALDKNVLLIIVIVKLKPKIYEKRETICTECRYTLKKSVTLLTAIISTRGITQFSSDGLRV